MRGWMRWVVLVLVVLGGWAIPGEAPGAAGQSTPAAGGTAENPVTVLAPGLVNPRGFAFDESGQLIVALGGEPESGAAIVEIVEGCPQVVVDGLPTARVAFGATAGMADVVFLDGQLYALFAGGDIDRDRRPNGVYRVSESGDLELVANISAFIRDNPVAERPGDYDTDGQPYRMLPVGDDLFVTEGNSNQLLRVSLDGTIARVADLSAGHPIPTGIAPAPDGSVYVALFTRSPYEEGTAAVVRITTDGAVEEIWTGLSLVTALAVDSEGNLYAAEMATGFGDDGSAIAPGTGRVVRRTGEASSSPVVTGLALPVAMAFDPDGALVVGGPAFGADDGEGTLIRFDLASDLPIAAPAGGMPEGDC